MKRIFCILSAVFCIILTGCTSSSSTALMCVENNTPQGYEISYEKLDGTKNKTLEVPEGEKYYITGTITTESGALTVSINEKQDGTNIFTSETFTSNGSFTAELESGVYVMSFTADNHCGSAELQWTIE